jgi:DNA-binding transcriptional LysR family regulator
VDFDSALLRAFALAADEGNVGRAATRMFISQQALSKRLARLESMIGATLFTRTARGVELTAEGTRLLPFARDALAAIDAVASISGLGDPVRVDVMDENSAILGLLRDAVDRDPSAVIRTSARSDRASAAALLLTGAVDVAFGRATLDPWPPELRRRPALWEAVGLLVGAGHEFADRTSVTLSELRRIPLRFPLDGAPSDWIEFLADLRIECGIEVDATGCSLGFDSFVDQPADDPRSATFYGMRMRLPDRRGLRVIPIVDPTPVFAWAAMTRSRVPAPVVDRLLGAEPGRLPPDAWLPSADRRWLRPG